MRIRNYLKMLLKQQQNLKSNNYSELTVVDVADRWRESDMWYQGRPRQRMKTEYEIRQ